MKALVAAANQIVKQNKFKCVNCETTEVENEGDLCDDCFYANEYEEEDE